MHTESEVTVDVKYKTSIERVIISLSEREAGRLMDLLLSHTDFNEEPWARELHDSLDEMEIDSVERTYPMPEDDILDDVGDTCGCPMCVGYGFGGDTDGAE